MRYDYSHRNLEPQVQQMLRNQKESNDAIKRDNEKHRNDEKDSKIIADWFMVHRADGDTCSGVKKISSGEKLMFLSEIQEMAFDIIDNGNHPAYKYFFNDLLVVEQGVFKWDGKTYKKVANKHDGISNLIPMENHNDHLNQ